MNDDNEIKLIDLGLPSGTLWCDRNIGANAPEEYGKYFAWGDVKGEEFKWIKLYEGYSYVLLPDKEGWFELSKDEYDTVYCYDPEDWYDSIEIYDNGSPVFSKPSKKSKLLGHVAWHDDTHVSFGTSTIDNKFSGTYKIKWSGWYKKCSGSSLMGNINNDAKYDTAMVNFGEKFALPTIEQALELIMNTECTVKTVNGIQGLKYVSKTNGNSIFIPFGGFCRDGGRYEINGCFGCWLSTAYNQKDAYALYGDWEEANHDDLFSKYYGWNIRAVGTLAKAE